MTYFTRRDGRLYCEDVALNRVAAEHGTPCYVYSRAAVENAFRDYDRALAGRPHLICYAVKANSNLAVLNLLARLGCGFDIVSGGELARVLKAGGDPGKIVFSGVGKTAAEMRAALAADIRCFNVESANELDRLASVATAMGKRAPVSLRVNPDVDAQTHPYIATGLKENKFGVAFEDALALYHKAAVLPGLRVCGIDYHIGSQLTEIEPFVAALQKILGLVDQLAAAGTEIDHIDLGGGLGIRYRDESPPSISDYVRAIAGGLGTRPQVLLLEPGRSMIANCGVLVTKVEYLKHTEYRNFAVVDAAMNDLMRPALYDAWHDILPVELRATATTRYEVVGPVCESGDFLGHDRALALVEGDLLAIMSAGAYGMSMSSNYNTRPRVAEVMIDGDRIHLVRARETFEQVMQNEKILS